MINQKAISAKLNYDVATMLEQEAFTTGLPKNRLINLAIEHYIRFSDARRRWQMYNRAAEFADLCGKLGL